jgi:hypothetical protein
MDKSLSTNSVVGPRPSEDKAGEERRRRCINGEILLGGATKRGAAAAGRIPTEFVDGL